MAFTNSTLSVIQRAGETLHGAANAVRQAIQGQTEQVAAIVARQPYSQESDQAYAHLQAVARMAHELAAMEDQLKAVYATAESLVVPQTVVLMALPGRDASRRHATTEDAVEDVLVKNAPSAKPGRASSSRAGRVRSSANDQKVLAYLGTALDRRSWRRATHWEVAQGATIPAGSVGVVLKRLIACGQLRANGTGMYRLG